VRAPRLANVDVLAAPKRPNTSALQIGKAIDRPGKVTMETMEPVRRPAPPLPQPRELRKNLHGAPAAE